MESAIGAVQNEGKTMYRAAKDFGVPMNTLRDRLIAKGIFKPRRPVHQERAENTRCDRPGKDRAKVCVSVDNDLLERWQDIGKSEGLAGNAAITRFLVSMYYRVGKQEELKSDIRCQECQNPLTLFCVNCKLMSPTSPPPSLPAGQMEGHTPAVAVVSASHRQTGVKTEETPSATPVSRPRKVKRSCRIKTRSCHVKTRLRQVKPSYSEVDVSDDDDDLAGVEEEVHAVGDWSEAEDDCQVEEAENGKDFGQSGGQEDYGQTGSGEDYDQAGSQEDCGQVEHDLLAQLVEQACKKVGMRTREIESAQPDESLEVPEDLQGHLVGTPRTVQYVCKLCQKVFKNKSALQQHRRVHNRQEHQCPTCGLSFKFPSRLNKHLKTHGTDRPHVCDKCGKCFVSVYYLRDHIKIHSEERRYKCKLCGAAFKQKPALYAHGKKHTNEKPFQCQYCGLKFRDSQKVKIHVRTHTGEKPYQCTLCDARFVSNSNMWQHCAYVHGKSTKTHQCPHCPLTFAAKGKLKVHMKNAHAIDDSHTPACQREGTGETGEADACQFKVVRHREERETDSSHFEALRQREERETDSCQFEVVMRREEREANSTHFEVVRQIGERVTDSCQFETVRQREEMEANSTQCESVTHREERETDSCQFEVVRQAVPPFYIELPGSSQLVSL